MKFKTLIASVLISLSSLAYGQVNLDSLNSVLNSSQDIIERWQAHTSLASYYADPLIADSFRIHNEEALAIALNTGEDSLLFTSYLLIGNYFQGTGDDPHKLEYYLKALTVAKRMNSPFQIGKICNNLSWAYIQLGDYNNGIEYGLESVNAMGSVPQNEKTRLWLAYAHNNLAIVYLKIDDTDESILHNDLAYGYTRNVANKHRAYWNIVSWIYALYADIYKESNALDSAEVYYQKTLQLLDSFDLYKGHAYMLNSYCQMLNEMQRYQEALSYGRTGLDYASKYGYNNYARDLALNLQSSFEALGQLDSAYHYAKIAISIQDSVLNRGYNAQIQNITYSHGLKERESEHKAILLRKNRLQLVFGFSGLFALILAGGFYSRNRFIRKSRDVISKEKDRSDSLLLNILPAEIAAELKEHGKATARDYDQVSILFTDFKQFTQLSEKLSAKELVEELNHCFEAFDAICEKFGIEKIKTLGDSYMAAGGLPVPTPDSTKKLILAALEMSAFVVNRQKERESAGLIPFEMRAGVHTGNVVAGIVGVKKFQYDIWGDTVNTASRMESNGQVGRVNISQTTYELIKGDPQFTFEHRGKVEAKGKGQVDMWFVKLA